MQVFSTHGAGHIEIKLLHVVVSFCLICVRSVGIYEIFHELVILVDVNLALILDHFHSCWQGVVLLALCGSITLILVVQIFIIITNITIGYLLWIEIGEVFLSDVLKHFMKSLLSVLLFRLILFTFLALLSFS